MSKKKLLLTGVAAVLAVVLAVTGFYAYRYFSTPAHIRKPTMEHLHIRTQVIVDGAAVDFSVDEYQQEYNKFACAGDLTEEPFHFHDNVDQMTHVHWGGMTGGELLKYYGWNFIGGDDSSLGYRYDKGNIFTAQPVPTLGMFLPKPTEPTNYNVYIGDENNYQQKNWDDFLHQDLETFFGVESNFEQGQTTSFNILDKLFPKVAAHGSVADGDENGQKSKEEDLTRINNLLGNIVIFAQQQEPTGDQVKARFNNLVPLSDSVCGG